MRKLATVQTIKEVKKIENADKICVYTVKGWQVVDLIDKYQPGERVVFFEIDSWIPHEVAPFLSKGKEPRVFSGIKGEKLRTVKLRGEYSQGLILPLTGLVDSNVGVDTDVTEQLNIIKWEAPIPAQLAGQVEGMFPSFIRKTDQERCVEENTVIETDEGTKTIKEIVEMKFSGNVLSYEEMINQNVWKKVIDWSIMEPSPDEWLKITTRTGKFMIVTKNHKIFLPVLGVYRESRFLKCGDTVKI